MNSQQAPSSQAGHNASPTNAKKSVWRLVLRVLLILLLLPPLAWAAVLLYNQHDETLEPETAAWLNFTQRPGLDPHRNGHLLLVGLHSQAADPALAAQQWLDAEQSMLSQRQRPLPADYQAAEQHILQPTPYSPETSLPCGITCFDDALARRAQYQQETPRLERYEQLLATPDYQEYHPVGIYTPAIEYGALYELDAAYLRRMVWRLEDGDAAGAYRDWSQRQQFYLRAGSGSSALLHLMVVNRQLQLGDYYLACMLARHPDSWHAAQQALPALDPARIDAVRSRLGQSIASELNVTVDALNATQAQGFSLLPPAQKNATLNLARRVIENQLARAHIAIAGQPAQAWPQVEQLCRRSPRQISLSLDNPFGKVLACARQFDLGPYAQRLDSLVSLNRETRQLLLDPPDAAASRKVRQDIETALERFRHG